MNYATRFVRIIFTFVVLAASATLLFTTNAEAQKSRKRATRKPAVKIAPKPATEATATNPATPKAAVEFGYVAGYSDGYTSGKTDYNTNAQKDFQRSTLYQEANRSYEKRYGDLHEYERGYKAGYEIAYNDGYVGREMNTRMPANLDPLKEVVPTTVSNNDPRNATKPRTRGKFAIAPDTTFKVRLESQISTKTNKEGDKFTAFVIDPNEYEGAIIEGHVASIKRSGKLTGQTELALDFDTITFKDGTNAQFRAQVEKVYATEKVKAVDQEGNVQSGNTTKDTTIRSVGGGALGAIIGGIAGGGKGAAIGAILGAGVGAGSVYIQGDKDLIFDAGTEIQIRTIGPKN